MSHWQSADEKYNNKGMEKEKNKQRFSDDAQKASVSDGIIQ